MSEPDDRLEEAARSLREATDVASPAAELTRARILAAHRSRTASRPVWLAAAAALLVLLGAPSAWALSTGRARVWIAAAVAAVTGEAEVPAPEEPPAPRPRRPRASEHVERVPEPTSIPEPMPLPAPMPVPEPVVPPEVTIPLDPTVTEAEPRPSRVEPVELDDPAERAERIAYRRAHALQFERGDHAAAIDAWSSYLEAHPDGRFAVEAAYNRAICLARAGRQREAIVALRPFADGTHAGYRQHEAHELIEALETAGRDERGVEE